MDFLSHREGGMVFAEVSGHNLESSQTLVSVWIS
jgi:hypothetical protein